MVKKTEIRVKLIDVEGIHGLIEVLTDLAAQAVKVVEGWESDLKDNDVGRRTEDTIFDLKTKILDLNNYVDEHLHDE